jgi:uncharacterized protein involved in exopolysaccharide biosynthesis
MSSVSSDGVSPLDYWRVVRKYGWIILLVAAVAMVLTATISMRSPSVYMATASIIPPIDILQKEQGFSAKLGGSTSSLLRSLKGAPAIPDMYAGILRSRELADRIIARFNLLKVYDGVRNWTGARVRLEQNTSIKLGDEGIVQITVKDADPNRAAAIANAYVDELDQRNRMLSSGQAKSKRIFLETRLKEIEREFNGIDALKSREVSIKEMLCTLLARECELARIEEAESLPSIQVLDKAVPPEMRMPRGTVKKAIMAGFVSLSLAVVLACLADAGSQRFAFTRKGDSHPRD